MNKMTELSKATINKIFENAKYQTDYLKVDDSIPDWMISFDYSNIERISNE